MSQVNVHDAKTNFSRLLERAHAGEEIIIAKNGRPFARLCALAPAQPRKPGLLKGNVDESFFAPLPEEEMSLWDGRGGKP
ncbi:MAG: type II toxin-antitoxin system Phd/YefM family antitoxin [Deltaproteobacteria bacterium]|nr:type II toxin-antitoxin system Phd/YefM family antitoxin [Deltaproteobacteria bacterium]